MSEGQEVRTLLEQISTHWPLISDPLQFVLRYAPAVRRYLAALIRDAHDAEDVTQNFLLHMVKQPFSRERMRSGRFRDYLKAVLRNAAITHLRQATRLDGAAANLDHVPAPESESEADAAWTAEWRNCLLGRAWEALEQHQRQAPDGLAYTVLRLATDHPDENSPALAARAAEQIGRPLQPAAFRKQLSRARRRFAQCIIDAIRQTLETPRAEDVLEELADLGMMPYVREFLPESFRGH